MKRIYINREAIMKNRETNNVKRRDLITVAFIDPDAPDDPTDSRRGCDRGAHEYRTGTGVEILGPSRVVHDPTVAHGASVWVETMADVRVVD